MPPTKSEYYGEDYSQMSDEQKFELSIMESHEATGILNRAYNHIRESDHAAFLLLNELRDSLIQDMIDNGEESWASCNKTMFLYRRNTAGIIIPVRLANGKYLS